MINIAFLYYDLMNLYGETGNIKALTNFLDAQKIKYKVHYLTISDELEFKQYDFVYMGYGTENNRNIILSHLRKYTDDIKEYIEENKYFLVTGNALSLFGKNFDDIKTLNIFDFEIITEKRKANEANFKMQEIEEEIVGFQNQQEYILNCEYPLFECISGRGYIENNFNEGIHYKNFYGTYLLGPILSRSPFFLEYITEKIMVSKNPNFKIKKDKLKLEKKAYQEFLNLYYTQK